MANLEIIIDPNELTSVQALFGKLEVTFAVDFIPGFLKDLDGDVALKGATFFANTEEQRYEIAFDIGLKIAEDSEGKAEHLILGMKISIHPDKTTAGKRTAEYAVNLEMPVAADPFTKLVFEGQVTEKMGTTMILEAKLTGAEAIPLPALFSGFMPSVSQAIPEELTIPLQQNLFIVLAGRANDPRGSRLLFGAGFHAGVDLGKVPVLRAFFDAEETHAAFTLELLVATHVFTHAELEVLSGVMEAMKSPAIVRPSSASEQDLTHGAYLVGHAAIGDLERTWFVPLRRRSGASKRLPARGAATGRSLGRSSGVGDALVTIGDNGAWLAVQRAAGAIHLQKLGLSYKNGVAEFVPEIVISIGGLRLILDGISILLPLSPKGAPAFRLDGFGIEYQNDSLQVGGAFLRIRHAEYDEYAGMAALGLKFPGKGGKAGASLGIGAIGAYAYVDGRPSIFLYASLDYPLGGPPFFFVTGFSAGFGVNRDLVSPALEDIESFPLVRQAIAGTPAPSTDNPSLVVAGQLRELAKHLEIVPDTGFLALGIKFTSFKQLEGFALLSAVLGARFEISALGLYRLKVPSTGTSPLVVVEMAVQARFAPAEGLLLVRGLLTEASYLLAESCKLTGGYAFATWFAGDLAGDFVITMGGYHPSFDPPAHYPAVPRVGLEWKVDNSLTIRGESYFALCAHAVMAGTSVEASWKSGKAYASFRIGADFLICWKPYAYDISLRVQFKAGWGPFSASLGADLHIWGPEFGGTARIKVFLFSFTIKFGNQSSALPLPIAWPEFRASFLPETDEVCSVAVSEGLTRKIKSTLGEEVWVVSAKELALMTGSVIPSKAARHPASSSPALAAARFGIAPMAVKDGDLQSEHRLSIWRDGVSVEAGKFKITVLSGKAPTALWGEPQVQTVQGKERLRLPSVNAPRFLDETISGLRIEPAAPPKGGITDSLPVEVLSFEPEALADAYVFSALPAFRAAAGDDDQRRAKIRSTIAVHATRDALLAALGFDPAEDVALTGDVADTFVFAPQVKDTLAAA